jgi:hypothetical protein
VRNAEGGTSDAGGKRVDQWTLHARVAQEGETPREVFVARGLKTNGKRMTQTVKQL